MPAVVVCVNELRSAGPHKEATDKLVALVPSPCSGSSDGTRSVPLAGVNNTKPTPWVLTYLPPTAEPAKGSMTDKFTATASRWADRTGGVGYRVYESVLERV